MNSVARRGADRADLDWQALETEAPERAASDPFEQEQLAATAAEPGLDDCEPAERRAAANSGKENV